MEQQPRCGANKAHDAHTRLLRLLHVYVGSAPQLRLLRVGVYTGSMLVPHFAGYIEKDRMEKTPDFMELNLKLNYTFVLNDHLKLQLNGGVNNIFDAFQKDLDKGADRDSKYFYGPTQPRTLFIGVKIFN